MTNRNSDLAWDNTATLLRLDPVGLEDDDVVTSLHSSPLGPLPTPHRTLEEAEDTASAELAPLRLDPSWSQGASASPG